MSYQHEKFMCHVYVHVLTKRDIETLFRNACPCKVLKKKKQKYLNILLPVICLQRQDDSLFLQTFPLCLINNLQTSSCSRLLNMHLPDNHKVPHFMLLSFCEAICVRKDRNSGITLTIKS